MHGPAVQMSVRLGVTLVSGRCEYIEVDTRASLDVLVQQAQIALGVGRGSLQSPGGEDLRGPRTIDKASLCRGDMLTLHMSQVRVVGSRRGSAFAAVLGDGSNYCDLGLC